MKICRIITAYSPYPFGGADIYAEKISREIVKRGNPTVVITINPYFGGSYEEDEGTKIYRFHPFNVSNVHKIGRQSILCQGIWTLLDIYNPYSYQKIKSILKKENPDIVHVHTPVDFTLAVFNAIKSLRLPLVYTIHDYFLLCRRIILLHGDGKVCTEENMNPLCRIYRNFAKDLANKNIDLVISPCEFNLNLHKKNGIFINTESRILHHGINLDSCNCGNNITNDSLGKSGIDILYAGGLTKHKGIHVLIQAFKLIYNLEARLHIVGGGVYEKELKCMASSDKRIIFHGKFPNKQMQSFYRNSDVLVVPSICYDVRPNVIPEAFSNGVPVIGAQIGGIPELVKENQTGFLFNPGDIEGLRSILEMVINNPEILKRMRNNCLEFVRQFEMAGYLNKLLDFYQQTIEINKRKVNCRKTKA